MKQQLITLCILQAALIALVTSVEFSPFCSICHCVIEDGKVTVDCSQNYETLTMLFNESNFRNASNNNTMYEIEKLNCSQVPLVHFLKPMPASSLKVLDLSEADLTEIVDGAFQNLQQMNELRLGHNHLGLLRPDMFKGIRKDMEDYPLRSLKTLRLNNNELRILHPDTFQHIEHHVERLYLNGNPLNFSDLPTTQAICGNVQLKLLDLSDTAMTMLPHGFFNPMGNLEELYLANNNISNVTTLGLQFAHSLRLLVLNNNPIVTISEYSAFPPIKTLQILHLCHMPELETIANHTLCNLNALEELHMHDNSKLHTIGMNAFIHVEDGTETPVIRKIKKLYLQNNKLTHLDLQLDWDRMYDFDISDNAWSCEDSNQWIVDTLIPIYCRVDKERCKKIVCASPVEMEGKLFYDLHVQMYKMRPLDYYGNHPEMDGTLLVCFLIGLLIGIVVILALTYAYKRHWFGLCDNSPAAYSRQFYGRTRDFDDL